MQIKRIFLYLLIVIFIFTNTSCMSGKGNKKTEGLTVYLTDYDGNFKNAVSEYNRTHKSAQINVKAFYQDQAEEYAEKIKDELASGSGPDIIIIRPVAFPSLWKLMNSGAFCDMNELIEKDKGFKIEDYNKNVINCGEYQGKRYLMPLNFGFQFLASTKEILDTAGINLSNSNWNLETVVSTANEFMKKGKDKYFFDPFVGFTSLLKNCGESFIDFENKKSSFDSGDFAKLLDTYKAIHPAINTSRTSAVELGESLYSGKEVMVNSPGMDVKDSVTAYQGFASSIDPYVLPYPTFSGDGHVTAYAGELVAINSKCKDKEAAFEYVKMLLSKKYQFNQLTYFIPVNKEAYRLSKESFLKNPTIGNLKSEALGSAAEKFVEMYDKLVSSIDKCYMDDYDIYKAVNDEITGFIGGGKSPEDAAKSIKQRVDAYLQDNSTYVQTSNNVNETTVNQDNKKHLKIYYMTYEKGIQNAIRKFHGTDADTELDETVFDNRADFKTKLVTELMSGAGPDIISFRYDTFPSLEKSVSSGAFADLNSLISQDGEFKLSDYNEKVLNYGVVNGKRYFIPLRYKVPFMSTGKKILEKNNIKIDESHWTWRDFADLAQKYMKENAGKNMYFICNNGEHFGILDIIMYSGVPFIDYKNKKSNFNSKDFFEMLDIYKDIYPAICPEDLQSKYPTVEDWFSNNLCVFETNKDSIGDIWGHYCNFKLALKDEYEMVPIPSFNGDNVVVAQPINIAAINNKCKDKKTAFNFIKTLLSEDIQGYADGFGNQNINIGLPANKNAIKKDLEYFSSSKVANGELMGMHGPMTHSLPESLASKVNHIVSSISKCDSIDVDIRNQILDMTQDFIDGKKTAEQAAKEIDNKISLILNE